MRQRTTFVQGLGEAVDPALIQVSDGRLTGPPIEAAREDRLTIALDELPDELQTLLRDTQALHLRWATARPHEGVVPLVSGLPPGLHLFYSPLSDLAEDTKALCPALRTIFGDINCSTPEESFTPLGHHRTPHAAGLQYFQSLESLSSFARYVADAFCPAAGGHCVAEAERLAEASSLDISYDGVAGVVRVTARWPYATQNLNVPTQQHRTEVGILAEDKPPSLEHHEMGMSGHLTVLGQHSTPSPTLFSFPARHRHADGSFSATFLSPTGLHPTLQIGLESNLSPSDHLDCSPYAYLTLPRAIFPDKYQLSDDLFLSSNNLAALRYLSQPVDLEAPEYVTKLWGSAVLVELSPPASGKAQPWSAEIPLHLRYLRPSHGGYVDIKIPYPAVFWACSAGEDVEFSTNPFDRANLGYDRLFSSDTAFWHVDPRPGSEGLLTNTVTVPVLDLEKTSWVGHGTAVAIILGFLCVVWKLFSSKHKPTVDSRGNSTLASSESKKRQ